MESYKEVLTFWLEEIEPKMWFTKDEKFDQLLVEKFGAVHSKISNNELTAWEDEAESALAAIIVLDQFSRNMFRDTPNSLAFDNQALLIAKKAIEKGFDKQVAKGRNFFYMPFMHSENLKDQEKCIELFRELTKDTNKNEEEESHYAVLHRNIVKRFGRFPHRNEILGRESTKEEIEFLKGPNSSF